MGRLEANGSNRVKGTSLGQVARLVMHEDEHAIVKEILDRVLGDDDCFAKVVASHRSDAGRAGDRLVLAKFLARMERHFALRAEPRRNGDSQEEAPDYWLETPPLTQKSGNAGG
jgi:hypothetical protein